VLRIYTAHNRERPHRGLALLTPETADAAGLPRTERIDSSLDELAGEAGDLLCVGIPAWSAGTAAVVFGLASIVFPDQRGAEGRGWGSLAIAGGVLFIAVAESEGRRAEGKREANSTPSFGSTTTA
jgi:hypothetical protein